jgi:hypothetical protein
MIPGKLRHHTNVLTNKVQECEKISEMKIQSNVTNYCIAGNIGLQKLKLATSNYPIAKSGFIASSLSGNLEIITTQQNRSKVQVQKKLSTKFYLVDGLIIGGNSGGPIICPKDFYYKVDDRHQLQSVNYKVANLIIGIVSFGWPGTGLTVIYPCDYILELINKPVEQ